MYIKTWVVVQQYLNMRIISFDIGMKNLAMCILEKDESNSIHILDWDVLNVVSGTTVATAVDQPAVTCSLCKRKAKYVNHDNTYFCCTSHRKTDGYISVSEASKLPKQTKKVLQEFCETHSIEYPSTIIVLQRFHLRRHY